MKFALLLGGLVGFVAVFALSVSVGKSPSRAIVEASVASVVMGLTFLWMGVFWIRNVKQMLMEKHRIARAALVDAEEQNPEAAQEPAAKPV